MEWRKKLSVCEAQILDCLEDLGLRDLTMPYRREGSVLVMEKGVALDRTACSVEILYNSCLVKMYAYQQEAFSPGIYAFYGDAEPPAPDESYADYLGRQLAGLADPVKSMAPTDCTAEKVYRILVDNYSACRRELEQLTSFELLHGDLHIGNILAYGGAYRLIDFEFARFGPKACEVAFFVCWEYIVGLRDGADITSIDEELRCLCGCNALRRDEAILVKQVFIPLFIVLALVTAAKNGYHRSGEIAAAARKFFQVYAEHLNGGGVGDGEKEK